MLSAKTRLMSAQRAALNTSRLSRGADGTYVSVFAGASGTAGQATASVDSQALETLKVLPCRHCSLRFSLICCPCLSILAGTSPTGVVKAPVPAGDAARVSVECRWCIAVQHNTAHAVSAKASGIAGAGRFAEEISSKSYQERVCHRVTKTLGGHGWHSRIVTA